MVARSKQLIQYARQIAVNWWRVLILMWKCNAVFVVFLLGLALFMGIIPGMQIQLVSLLVESAAKAIRGRGDLHLIMQALLWGVGMGSISLLSLLLGIVQQYVQSLLQVKVANAMNMQIMQKALTLSLQHYEDDKLYDSLQRASSESAYRPYQVFIQLMTFGTQVMSLVSVSTILVSWNWIIALVILLSPIPIACSQLFFSKRRHQLEWARSPEWRYLSYLLYLTTHARSFKEIQLFQLGDFFLKRGHALYGRFYTADKALLTKQMQVDIPLGILRVGITSCIQLYIIWTTILAGKIGMLAGYLQAISSLQENTQGIISGLGQLYQNCLYLDNLFEFLDTPPSSIKSGTRKFPRQLQKGIEFCHVSFCYPGTTHNVLSKVTFQIPVGTRVALVGHNGAGKTTIIKLLARLYEPTDGQIFIDDVPIEEYDLDDLRRHISIIFQDFVQYEVTARENIGFGNLDQLDNQEQVCMAAEASKASKVITHLPQQYETQLGRIFEQGHELSIGQWQKIALARAFIRSAPILLLDEPTASIDAATEAEIFAGLYEVTRKATTLLIAHRFSTVRMADRIVVLEQGKVIEEGTHEYLMRRQGTYAHLFNLQAAGYI